MSRIIFLVEEPSMKVFLEGLLPRFFRDLSFLCIAHEGKKDLEKSVPRKLKAWHEPGARFIIVRDKDLDDCGVLKQRLLGLCPAGHRDRTLVRIACHELEAWYFGDPSALADAFGDEHLRKLDAREMFRQADEIEKPSRELERLVPAFQKVSGARAMASRLNPATNRSRSFQVLIQGIESLAQ